jgi:hypothetical protein
MTRIAAELIRKGLFGFSKSRGILRRLGHGVHAELAVAGGRAWPRCAAGEERLRKVAREAGFSNLRRAAQTPVNLILELTP